MNHLTLLTFSIDFEKSNACSSDCWISSFSSSYSSSGMKAVPGSISSILRAKSANIWSSSSSISPFVFGPEETGTGGKARRETWSSVSDSPWLLLRLFLCWCCCRLREVHFFQGFNKLKLPFLSSDRARDLSQLPKLCLIPDVRWAGGEEQEGESEIGGRSRRNLKRKTWLHLL